MVGEDALANQLLGQRAERGADLFLPALVGVGEALLELRLDLVGALVTLGLAADGQSGGQLVGGRRGDRVIDVFAVGREDRVLGGRFSGRVGQLLLGSAQRRDE